MKKFLALKIENAFARKLMLIIAKFAILAAHIGLFLQLFFGGFLTINGEPATAIGAVNYVLNIVEDFDFMALISAFGFLVMIVFFAIALITTLIRLIISIVVSIVSTASAYSEEKGVNSFKTVTNQFQKSFFSVLSLVIVTLLVSNSALKGLLGYIILYFAICFIARIITLLASETRVVSVMADTGLKILQFLSVGTLVILFTRIEFSTMLNGVKVIVTSVFDFDGLSFTSIIGYVLQYLVAPIIFLSVLPVAKAALAAMFDAKRDDARRSKRSAYSISLLVMVCIYIAFMFASATVAKRVDTMFMPQLKYYVAMVLFSVAYLLLIRIKDIDSIIPNPALAEATAAPAEEVPAEAEEAPVEEAPVEEAAVEEVPAEEVPAEETPAEEAPAEAEEAPVEEAPAEEAPAEEAPVEEAPVEEADVEEAPVEEAPVEEAAVEEAPVEEAPAEEAPAEEAPAEEEKTNE